MGIKVYRLSNGGNNWQDFLGQALGYYLGNRLNTIQENRAQKAYEEAGFGNKNLDPTDDEVTKAVQNDLESRDMGGVGMDARDYIGKQKYNWGVAQSKIDDYKKELGGLDSQREDYAAQRERIEKAIAEQQAKQGFYHDQAERVRGLANQRGWDLTGYGSGDAYNSRRVTTAPGQMVAPTVPQGINIGQPLDEKGIINKLAGQMNVTSGTAPLSPEAQNVMNSLTDKYKLSFSDLGLDEDTLRNAARADLRNKKELEQMQNFDADKARAAAKKAAGNIYIPEQRQKFLDAKEKEIGAMQDKINKYNNARKVQALAAPLSQVNQFAAALAIYGMLPTDTNSLMDMIKFQPKATVVNNGNMNTVTYGGLRPAEHYAVGAAPNDILRLKGILNTNATGLKKAAMDNENRLAVTNIKEGGANNRYRMGLDYDLAKDTKAYARYAKENGIALTEDENTENRGADRLYENALSAGTLKEFEDSINSGIDGMLQDGYDFDTIAKSILNSNKLSYEEKLRAKEIIEARKQGG